MGDGGAPVEIEATPLDGEPEPEPALLVLEPAAANVLIVEGATVVTPPLNGRPRFETGARLRDVLRESAVVETR